MGLVSLFREEQPLFSGMGQREHPRRTALKMLLPAHLGGEQKPC